MATVTQVSQDLPRSRAVRRRSVQAGARRGPSEDCKDISTIATRCPKGGKGLTTSPTSPTPAHTVRPATASSGR